jgi:acyl-CoA dehydrogenase
MNGFSPALCAHIARVREWGRAEVRPAGLEADRNGAPLPADHPYFAKYMAFRREHFPALEDDAVPEGPAVQMAALNEENAYWDRGMGVAAPGPGLPSRIVATSGTPDQRERFLGPFRGTDQPRWGSFALTEPGGGSDTAAFRTRATRTDRGYLLSGAKCFIGNAARADWVLVQANLDPDKGRSGQRAFFVEHGNRGMTGIKIEKKMGLRAYESVSFILEDCCRTKVSWAANGGRGPRGRAPMPKRWAPSTPRGLASPPARSGWRVPPMTRPSVSPKPPVRSGLRGFATGWKRCTANCAPRG